MLLNCGFHDSLDLQSLKSTGWNSCLCHSLPNRDPFMHQARAKSEETSQELRMLSSVTLNCQVRGQKVKGLVVIYKGRYRAVSDSRLVS